MRLPFFILLFALPLLTFGQQSPQQKRDSLKMDTLLSAFRHDFVEKQFNYCVDRIDGLEKKVKDLDDKKESSVLMIFFLTLACGGLTGGAIGFLLGRRKPPLSQS